MEQMVGNGVNEVASAKHYKTLLENENSGINETRPEDFGSRYQDQKVNVRSYR